MTNYNNINKRREYIKHILEMGLEIDIRKIANEWNSSVPAITNDISIIKTGKSAYKKHLVVGENTRARRMGAKGELSRKDWGLVLKKYDYGCAICGSKENITIDHIIPLSKGGNNTVDNIQPLCKSCNSRKKDNIIP